MDDTQNQMPGVPQSDPTQPAQPGGYTPPSAPVSEPVTPPVGSTVPEPAPVQEPTVVPEQGGPTPATPPAGGDNQGGTQGMA